MVEKPEEPKKVDDTDKLPTIDPKTGEVIEPKEPLEEPEKEPEKESEKESEKEPEKEPETKEPQEPKEPEEPKVVDWEKRYKDQQSANDTELAKTRRLLAPYEKYIVRKESGELDFDFSKTSPKADKPETPKEPNDDLWMENPKEAAKQQFVFMRHEDNLVQQEHKTRAQMADAETKYWDTRNKTFDGLKKEYPQLEEKDSELFKRADEIIHEDPAMSDSPYVDKYAIKMAASELGIKAIEVKATGPAPKKKGDSTYLIAGKGGKGPARTGNLGISDAEFETMTPDQQTKYMEDWQKKQEET